MRPLSVKKLAFISSLMLILLLCGLLILHTCITVNAAEISDNSIVSKTPLDLEKAESLFALNGLDYYAYMNLDVADSELHPIIIEARSRIINSKSWVADEAYGWITDREGNIVEILPKFHDIFPDDWEDITEPPQIAG